MKNFAFALVASLIIFSSCGKKDEGTHTHEDGSTHADHSDTTKQEEFNAADSTEHRHDSTEHTHPHN
jgi:hypothetical protein